MNYYFSTTDACVMVMVICMLIWPQQVAKQIAHGIHNVQAELRKLEAK